LISIYYHPNEFDHTEFWDAVIWAHGANPPREEWKLPRKRTLESRNQTLTYFNRYLEFILNMPGVRFVTGSEMVQMYADKSVGMTFAGLQVTGLARSLTSEISFQKVDDVYLSAAESFSVLLKWYLRKPEEGVATPIPGLMGPARRESVEPGTKVERWEFRKACEDSIDAMSRSGRVPSILWIGAVPVAPADFLATLASEILGENSTSTLLVKKGNFTADHYVADDQPGHFDWPILPQGFRAPHVMDLARLQSWSLKPAVRNDNPGSLASGRPAPRK
jgi:hypothetical protein